MHNKKEGESRREGEQRRRGRVTYSPNDKAKQANQGMKLLELRPASAPLGLSSRILIVEDPWPSQGFPGRLWIPRLCDPTFGPSELLLVVDKKGKDEGEPLRAVGRHA
eukprot:7882571-Pyramimonas_sp.AAC.2